MEQDKIARALHELGLKGQEGYTVTQLVEWLLNTRRSVETLTKTVDDQKQYINQLNRGIIEKAQENAELLAQIAAVNDPGWFETTLRGRLVVLGGMPDDPAYSASDRLALIVNYFRAHKCAHRDPRDALKDFLVIQGAMAAGSDANPFEVMKQIIAARDAMSKSLESMKATVRELRNKMVAFANQLKEGARFSG